MCPTSIVRQGFTRLRVLGERIRCRSSDNWGKPYSPANTLSKENSTKLNATFSKAWGPELGSKIAANLRSGRDQ